MSTIQIVGIAVAAVVVVLLIVALIVTRKRGDAGAGDEAAAGEMGSFLDSAPSDTLAKLGRAEHVPEPAASSADAPGPESGPEPGVVMTATGVAAGSLSAEIWPDEDGGAEFEPAEADETETTGEIPVFAAAEERGPLEPVAGTATDAPDEAAEAATVPGTTFAPATAPAAAGPSDKLVPLSSIIVTTSTKMVDLEDPEIRRMLTDLVTFEIDQATEFREAGQSLDAVLQLTEAEKICRALGKEDTAREISEMMRGLQA
jgi:hypothetical protein